MSCLWGNELHTRVYYSLHEFCPDSYQKSDKLWIFHTEAFIQYLLSEKVFHISQYLVHLHHLTHQLPVKITCREIVIKELTIHITFLCVTWWFLRYKMETPWRAKEGRHYSYLSPVGILRASTASSSSFYNYLHEFKAFLDWTLLYTTETGKAETSPQTEKSVCHFSTIVSLFQHQGSLVRPNNTSNQCHQCYWFPPHLRPATPSEILGFQDWVFAITYLG